MSRDILADWPDIVADPQGNIHVGFHGTGNSGKYGQDEAFYVRRPAVGLGAWSAWEQPVSLHPVNRATRQSYSYAPSLALDPETDTVVAVVFFDYQDQSHEAFDSDALLLRGGRLVGAPIALSRNAKTAIDANRGDDAVAPGSRPPRPALPAGRWAGLAGHPLHGANPGASRHSHYVIYQRREMTNLLKAGTQ